jgi:hypothetical protein
VAGLAAWYKADAISGVADGTAVAAWADSSGNGHTATAPASGRAPVYKAGVVNGLPVLRFDGVDDQLQAYWSLAQPTTVFVVYAVRASNGSLQFVTDGFNNATMADYVTPTDFGMYAGGSTVTKSGFTYGAFHVVASTFAGASSALYPDGGPAVTGNPGGASPLGITVGASGADAVAAAADVAEVVVYNRALASSEVDGVGRYLAAKYARAWAHL